MQKHEAYGRAWSECRKLAKAKEKRKQKEEMGTSKGRITELAAAIVTEESSGTFRPAFGSIGLAPVNTYLGSVGISFADLEVVRLVWLVGLVLQQLANRSDPLESLGCLREPVLLLKQEPI